MNFWWWGGTSIAFENYKTKTSGNCWWMRWFSLSVSVITTSIAAPHKCAVCSQPRLLSPITLTLTRHRPHLPTAQVNWTMTCSPSARGNYRAQFINTILSLFTWPFLLTKISLSFGVLCHFKLGFFSFKFLSLTSSLANLGLNVLTLALFDSKEAMTSDINLPLYSIEVRARVDDNLGCWMNLCQTYYGTWGVV